MSRSLDGRPAIILAALLSLFGCCSMVMASDSAWFSGGGFDGYDHIIADDGTLPGIQSGSVISFK